MDDPTPVACPHCDFSGGTRGMDRCHVCKGTGSCYLVRGQFFPGTKEGYAQAMVRLAQDRDPMPLSFTCKLTEPLGLAVVDLISMAPANAYMITRVNVPHRHRGRGIARALMAECLAAADRYGANLQLVVSSSDGLSADQLKAWYQRLGFVMNISGIMVRSPKFLQ